VGDNFESTGTRFGVGMGKVITESERTSGRRRTGRRYGNHDEVGYIREG